MYIHVQWTQCTIYTHIPFFLFLSPLPSSPSILPSSPSILPSSPHLLVLFIRSLPVPCSPQRQCATVIAIFLSISVGCDFQKRGDMLGGSSDNLSRTAGWTWTEIVWSHRQTVTRRTASIVRTTNTASMCRQTNTHGCRCWMLLSNQSFELQ